MNFVINGIHYYVDRWGTPTGAPLLLLHGFTGNSFSWRSFESYWHEYNVIAVDIVGHGKTDSPVDVCKYNIESAAGDLYNILDKLEIGQTSILGYSMGGRLALTFAIKYPEKVKKLILESASPGLKTESEREARRIQDERLASRIKESGIEKFVDYWENISLFQTQKKLPESIRQQIRTERLGNNSIGLINSLTGMGTGAQPSWWDELDQISAPVFLITGSIDEKFCIIAKSMMDGLKNGKWLTIDECGHAIHVEKPKIFGTIVNEFLSQENE